MPSIVAQAFNPGTQGTKGRGITGNQPDLHNEFQDIQGYVKISYQKETIILQGFT